MASPRTSSPFRSRSATDVTSGIPSHAGAGSHSRIPNQGQQRNLCCAKKRYKRDRTIGERSGSVRCFYAALSDYTAFAKPCAHIRFTPETCRVTATISRNPHANRPLCRSHNSAGPRLMCAPSAHAAETLLFCPNQASARSALALWPRVSRISRHELLAGRGAADDPLRADIRRARAEGI
jgi:hypothetical protein